jgi:hypothetical protein
VGSVPLPGYWYDKAVEKNDRYLGTAKSGPDPSMAKSGAVRTRQLLNFMPRAMRHKVKHVGAGGSHGHLMTAKAVNDVSTATNRAGDQEQDNDELG